MSKVHRVCTATGLSCTMVAQRIWASYLQLSHNSLKYVEKKKLPFPEGDILFQNIMVNHFPKFNFLHSFQLKAEREFYLVSWIFQSLTNAIFQQIYYSLKTSSLELLCFVLLSKTACEVDHVLLVRFSSVRKYGALNKVFSCHSLFQEFMMWTIFLTTSFHCTSLTKGIAKAHNQTFLYIYISGYWGYSTTAIRILTLVKLCKYYVCFLA